MEMIMDKADDVDAADDIPEDEAERTSMPHVTVGYIEEVRFLERLVTDVRLGMNTIFPHHWRRHSSSDR